MLTALAAVVLLGPACIVPTVPVPAHEPVRHRGPAELVAGLYMQGGAYRPGCGTSRQGPYAGTLVVRSTSDSTVVASETLHRSGVLFTVRLAPGRYTVTATESGGLRSVPAQVTIPRGTTVRQDLFIDVP